jgi:hypothetical protein
MILCTYFIYFLFIKIKLLRKSLFMPIYQYQQWIQKIFFNEQLITFVLKLYANYKLLQDNSPQLNL